MKTVYKVTYDVRVGRHWLSGDNVNGFESINVVTTGDVRDACHRAHRPIANTDYGGKSAGRVRFLRVEPIATGIR